MEARFMQAAIDSAREGIQQDEGGPFGACVVRDGEVISVAHNTVLKQHDPTCHAEMNAIRRACKTLGTYILDECELYTTAEPCPMCMGAILWARIPKIYIGVTQECAASHGFDDAHFYRHIGSGEIVQRVLVRDTLSKECEQLFTEWSALQRKLY